MINLMHGDCLELMKQIPDNSIDMVLTDPPYNIAKENNFKTMGRAGIDFGEWDKNADILTYIESLPRILKKDGSVFIFNDWKNLGDIAKKLESVGFIVKDMVRWEKLNPMPRNRDRRYVVDFECAIWAVNKKAKWTFNRQSETYDRAMYKCSLTPKREKINGGHTTQKPVHLLEQIVKTHTNNGDNILDCFMGSGSTGVAAKNLNRKFIGIEMDDKYFEIAKERINELQNI